MSSFPHGVASVLERCFQAQFRFSLLVPLVCFSMFHMSKISGICLSSSDLFHLASFPSSFIHVVVNQCLSYGKKLSTQTSVQCFLKYMYCPFKNTMNNCLFIFQMMSITQRLIKRVDRRNSFHGSCLTCLEENHLIQVLIVG